MALDTFTPPLDPSPGTSTKYESKLRTAPFGDGYTQATADGINSVRRVVSLSWDLLTQEQADEIENFVVAKKGGTPFYYALRGDQVRKWTSPLTELDRTRGSPNTVKLTLREDFSLAS